MAETTAIACDDLPERRLAGYSQYELQRRYAHLAPKWSSNHARVAVGAISSMRCLPSLHSDGLQRVAGLRYKTISMYTCSQKR